MKQVSITLFIICTVLATLWTGIRIFSAYDFSNNCGGYLKRAANANSIELAKENLDKGILYLEKNNLTEGQVSIFLKQPKNDIEYWYRNLKTAQSQLENVDENISNLEESNILMKLRETLTDSGKDSSELVCPDGISIYPNNVLYFWLGMLSWIGFCVFGCIWLFNSDFF